MSIRKTFLFGLFFILFSIATLYAGGANEGNLYYFPRSVIDNNNLMIELAGTYDLQASQIDADFKNTSENQLAIFRIRDSLKSDVTYNGTTNENVKITIESLDNWEFVHETNTTSKRRFYLSAFCTDLNRTNEREYNPQTAVKQSFQDDGTGYSLTFGTTTFYDNGFSLYANKIRDYDFCIVLPSVPSGTYLESGYYRTRLKVTITSYVKSESYTTGILVRRMRHREVAGYIAPFTITLRGYVGITPEMSEDPFFIVSSSDDTYTMDLTQEGPYKIGNISFTNSQLSTKDPEDASNNEKGGKYKIYISPTNIYNASGKYCFIRMGTENEARKESNTVYYDLYKTKSTDSRITTGSGTEDSSYSIITPDFASTKVSSQGMLGGEDIWKYSWSLNQDLYLKVRNASTERLPGLYYSYVYFTLVTN